MELVAVAAVAENGVIGDNGELPWPSVPADRRQYRDRVSGHPVILGRRTFESMLHDLPGAVHIVLTTEPDRDYGVETVTVATSVPDAIECAEVLAPDRVYVLGGGTVYHAFFPYFDRLLISRVPGAYGGDTTFPEIDRDQWALTRTRVYDGFTLETWTRRPETA